VRLDLTKHNRNNSFRKKKAELYKPRTLGLAEAKFKWVNRYLRALKHLRDCKLGQCLYTVRKNHHIDWVWRGFELLPENIRELDELDEKTPNYYDWQIEECDQHIAKVIGILNSCKHIYDTELKAAREAQQELIQKHIKSHCPNSRRKRMHNMPHKYMSQPLPGVMKRNDGKPGMVTGNELNESWGDQLDINSAFKMLSEPTEIAPPWLQPELWADTCAKMDVHQPKLMNPISMSELDIFLKEAGTTAPGIDRIQYDVIRIMLYNERMVKFKLAYLLLDFLNEIINNKAFPSSIKLALLTFIPKSGDPLLHTNYRGIVLLSCVYKIVTGILNHRLSSMLAEHGGMESNQGGNTKGLNSAHKAAVLMNIIADARAQDKGLHIIYTDI
jgi:hypothetical protein